MRFPHLRWNEEGSEKGTERQEISIGHSGAGGCLWVGSIPANGVLWTGHLSPRYTPTLGITNRYVNFHVRTLCPLRFLAVQNSLIKKSHMMPHMHMVISKLCQSWSSVRPLLLPKKVLKQVQVLETGRQCREMFDWYCYCTTTVHDVRPFETCSLRLFNNFTWHNSRRTMLLV